MTRILRDRVNENQEVSLNLRHQTAWKAWSAWIDQHPGWVLLSILLFALVIGAIKLQIDPPSPEFNWENRWWQIALHVARGEGYVSCKPEYFPFCGPGNEVTAMREPLPVLTFALIAIVTNESLLAASAFIVVLNLATILAVFFLTREISNTQTGLLAAFLWACYLPPVRLFYSQISGDLFACLGITLGLVFYLRAQRSNLYREWLASGLFFGVAILSRSAVLAVAAILTAALFFWVVSRAKTSPSHGLRWLYPVLIFTFAWTAMILPWVIRNSIVFGRPVIGSTLSGYYLYRQNHILPTDDYLRFVSGGEFESVIADMVSRRPDLTMAENEAQMNEIYMEEGKQVIQAHPLRYVELSLYRFMMLWFNWKVNEVYGKANTVGDWIMVMQNLLLLAGGMIGLRGRWHRVWPVALTIISFSLLYMAVMAHLPYIVAIVPGLVALTAIAVVEIGTALTRIMGQNVRVDNAA